MGIKRTTAYTILRRGREENLPKGGSQNRQIDDKILQHAVEILECNPMTTLTQLNHAIRDELPIKPHFTDQALSKALEGRRITFEIARDCPAERNSYDIMESRHSYALWIMSPAIIYMRKNFVDEFGINV